MATLQDKRDVKREIVNYYNQEIDVLNHIKKTIEELEGQIGNCANKIEQIQMSKIELEDKFEDEQIEIKKLPIKDLKSSAELISLKKDFKKKIKKFRECKYAIDKRISNTVHKLHKNGISLQNSDKKRKSIREQIDRWVLTIQNTYEEIYNA